MSEPDSGPPPAVRSRYRGDALSDGTLRVPAHPSYLSLIGITVKWFARRAGLSDEQCEELEVAVDEACTNVIRYAFPDRTTGEMTVVCSLSESGLGVSILDKGEPFDPREGIGIAGEKRSRDPASGGMGLLLIRRLTDAVRYRWDETEGNQLTLVKHK